MTWKRRVLVTLVAAMFGLLVAVVATSYLTTPSNRVIKQWHQPKDVDYQSYDPYTLSVVEGEIEWYLFGFKRRHYLFIGRGSEAPAYGHYLDYTFHPGSGDIDAHIGRSTVQWAPEGLTFVEATGHRLFVPKVMFIGGR